MAKLDDAAVLTRAKALAERDGFTWELNFRPMVPGSKIELQRYLSDDLRQQYLIRARTELQKEADHA